jgi:hypothetical protein
VTLLTAANEAQRELSLSVTTTLIADGQETQNLLYRLANKEVKELLRRTEYTFPALRRTQSFTASLASLQSAPGKPANFFRAIPGTFWNDTTARQIGGPLTEEEWALANGASVTSSIQQYAMFRYDGLHLFPAPTAANTITYDYVINTPVLAADGATYKSAFSVDTDTYLLDEELLILGMVWRYLKTKGRDYAEALRDYEFALAAFALAARTPRSLSIAPYSDNDGIGMPNIPDSGYGS